MSCVGSIYVNVTIYVGAENEKKQTLGNSQKLP